MQCLPNDQCIVQHCQQPPVVIVRKRMVWLLLLVPIEQTIIRSVIDVHMFASFNHSIQFNSLQVKLNELPNDERVIMYIVYNVKYIIDHHHQNDETNKQINQV